MTISREKFAQLLTEAVHRIRIRESKTVQIVQDELGYMLGRQGGSVIEYWRKGHIPQKYTEVEKLAREMVQRGGLEREWLEQFLRSADHPNPTGLCNELFPGEMTPALVAPTSAPSPTRTKRRPSPTQFAPFIIGPPIAHPRYFFGREGELKQIFDLWKRLPLQNVAVIGLRRSGKTSLLHYLMGITTAAPVELRPGQRSNWLPQPQHYRWVFVDFQDARMANQERLLRYLLIRMEMPVPDPCDLSNFMDVASEHLRTPTIILMDEIGAALSAPELDLPFWWSLRSLGTNQTGGNLGFLLTSHEPPGQLAHECGKPSPFFNIFGHVITLGPLCARAARELIASSPHPFDAADVEWILTQSGRWPVLLQILCHARLVALENRERGEAWKEDALRQAEPYRYLLDG